MSLPKKLFTPTGTKVALKVNKVTETPGGVQLPEITQSHESVSAWVVAVGPDCKQLKRGDLVLSYANTPACRVTWKGETLLVLEEDTLAAVVDKESE